MKIDSPLSSTNNRVFSSQRILEKCYANKNEVQDCDSGVCSAIYVWYPDGVPSVDQECSPDDNPEISKIFIITSLLNRTNPSMDTTVHFFCYKDLCNSELMADVLKAYILPYHDYLPMVQTVVSTGDLDSSGLEGIDEPFPEEVDFPGNVLESFLNNNEIPQIIPSTTEKNQINSAERPWSYLIKFYFIIGLVVTLVQEN